MLPRSSLKGALQNSCRYLLLIYNRIWNFKMSTFSSLFPVIYRVKSVRIRNYSGPHFPVFWLNTERYSIFLRIQSVCGKMRTRITPNTDFFYTGIYAQISLKFCSNKQTTTAHQADNHFLKYKIFQEQEVAFRRNSSIFMRLRIFFSIGIYQ